METNFPKVCDLFMKTMTKKADSRCRPLSDLVFCDAASAHSETTA
ncbi:hypothetical protein RUMCAL_01134 [Ruminococcus callidus ATCC 27760]|uniref:Uncharacterized protein n=1 Tax=Ruminococcus callidus ATCC 27760 TaxID=411473 RepID=U2KW38_9FIRM|nr:hypothetical protein RUMCAL_01134 [Ruminococcus callidus ATCC 27760]